jgi:hypothetical protein
MVQNQDLKTQVETSSVISRNISLSSGFKLFLVNLDKSQTVDAIKRTLWTAIQVGAAYIIIKGNFSTTTIDMAASAGGLSLLKSIVLSSYGNKNKS